VQSGQTIAATLTLTETVAASWVSRNVTPSFWHPRHAQHRDPPKAPAVLAEDSPTRLAFVQHWKNISTQTAIR